MKNNIKTWPNCSRVFVHHFTASHCLPQNCTSLPLSFCREATSKVEACLTASLNTLDMALWDFSQEKEPPAIEEKQSPFPRMIQQNLAD
uniref:Uncharacterized protein n=1 Tax=Salix viminalis TaxID=40686 RepID=A0A6N2K8J2_SALVM